MRHSKLLEICGRRRWTGEEARAVIHAAEGSGLAVTEFAHRHGVDPQRLYQWRRRLGSVTHAHETPAFVEVKRSPLQHAPIQIELRGGRIVRVTGAFDAGTLRRVIEVLEAATSPC